MGGDVSIWHPRNFQHRSRRLVYPPRVPRLSQRAGDSDQYGWDVSVAGQRLPPSEAVMTEPHI